MVATAIDEYGVEETLDAVESEWLEMVAGNANIFQLAAHYADVCAGDGATESRPVLPGTERSVQLGGEGTPRVREFAAAEFGARMRLGTVGAKHYIADALDARHRLPRLWARLCDGEVRVAWIRRVATRTRDLSAEAAAKVDDDMVEIADGRLPWSRFCDVLEGRIVAADPEAARKREEEQRREVFATSNRHSDAGMKGFYIRGPVSLIVRFDATIAYLAQALAALGDTDDEDHRRVKACAILANPTQAVEMLAAFAAHRARAGKVDTADEPAGDELIPDLDGRQPMIGTADEEPSEPAGGAQSEGTPTTADDGPPVPRPFRPGALPEWLRRAYDPSTSVVLDWPKLLPLVCLYVHVSKETLESYDGGVVRCEGESPITLQYLRDHLGPLHNLRVLPVLDLADQDPVDSYEVPRRHRQAVHPRTPADCFPFSSNTSSAIEVDHTDEFVHDGEGRPVEPGQSRMGNGTRKLTPPGPRESGSGAPRKGAFEVEILAPDFDIAIDDGLRHNVA